MAVNEIEIAASPDEVFAVLADPERYVDWVVGTSDTETVDPDWPNEGAKLRYEAGVGPLKIADVTEVVESDPPRRLLLRARMRPVGEIGIELVLEPRGTGTRVTMTEEPAAGLLEVAHTPVSDAVTARRNDVALRRLRELVEGSR
jgi:uncharacterized protein YndB with AHSA1/START domain